MLHLSSNLLSKDTPSFWNNWKSLNGNSQSHTSLIDGFINHNDIANRFAHVYESVYKRSTADECLHKKFDYEYSDY